MTVLSRRVFMRNAFFGCAGLAFGTPALPNMDPIRVTSKYPKLLRHVGLGELKLSKETYAVGEPVGFSIVIDLDDRAIRRRRVLRGSIVAYIDSGDAIETDREITSLILRPDAPKGVPMQLVGPAATKAGTKTFIVMGAGEAGDMVSLTVV